MGDHVDKTGGPAAVGANLALLNAITEKVPDLASRAANIRASAPPDNDFPGNP